MPMHRDQNSPTPTPFKEIEKAVEKENRRLLEDPKRLGRFEAHVLFELEKAQQRDTIEGKEALSNPSAYKKFLRDRIIKYGNVKEITDREPGQPQKTPKKIAESQTEETQDTSEAGNTIDRRHYYNLRIALDHQDKFDAYLNKKVEEYQNQKMPDGKHATPDAIRANADPEQFKQELRGHILTYGDVGTLLNLRSETKKRYR